MNTSCITPRALVFVLMIFCGCAIDGVSTPTQIPGREREQKCLGSGLDRNLCMQFANQRCAGGFEIFEKEAKEEDGVVRRGYYFKCLL